jgi:hypothetical protein
MRQHADKRGIKLKLMSTVMTTREQLKALVEELPEELLRDAIYALTHLEDDEPLSTEEIADIEASEEDIKHGPMIPLEEFEKQRGLS